jgi:hypothetical protein
MITPISRVLVPSILPYKSNMAAILLTIGILLTVEI